MIIEGISCCSDAFGPEIRSAAGVTRLSRYFNPDTRTIGYYRSSYPYIDPFPS